MAMSLKSEHSIQRCKKVTVTIRKIWLSAMKKYDKKKLMQNIRKIIAQPGFARDCALIIEQNGFARDGSWRTNEREKVSSFFYHLAFRRAMPETA